MDNQHLSKHDLDDEISKRAFDQFFKSLDPFKLYFYQSDIDEFMKSYTKLDDEAKRGPVVKTVTFRSRSSKYSSSALTNASRWLMKRLTASMTSPSTRRWRPTATWSSSPRHLKKPAIVFASKSSTACCC